MASWSRALGRDCFRYNAAAAGTRILSIAMYEYAGVLGGGRSAAVAFGGIERR
jgi:hypothetical protein